MIRLLAIDMDGTLLTRNKEIQPAVAGAVADAVESGVKIVLCTGRTYSGVRHYAEDLGLTGDDEYAVVSNGALIYKTSTENILRRSLLTKDNLLHLVNSTPPFDTQYCFFDENDEMYAPYDEPNRILRFEGSMLRIDLKKLHPKDFDKNYVSKLVVTGEPDDLDHYERHIPAEICHEYYCVRSLPFLYEFLHRDAHKGSAVHYLAQSLGFSRREVMAIGDGNNDLTMLEYAGVSVAMENAPDDVKRAAQYVTDSNEDEGVAKAIRRHVLR